MKKDDLFKLNTNLTEEHIDFKVITTYNNYTLHLFFKKDP